MRRRDFLALLGGALALSPMALRAQKAIPVIGFLRSTTASPFTHLVKAFHDGLKETGFAEGENVAIQYRYADNQLDRLPALAAELVQRPVSLIVGNSLAAEAAKRMTETIPIVFVTSDDPVKRGLVASLARPGGNTTGFTFFGGGQLAAKRLEILRELTPKAAVIGFLMDPTWPAATVDLADLEGAAHSMQQRIVVAKAANEAELGVAVGTISRAGAGAMIVGGAPRFSSERPALIALSARHSLPTIYDLRDYVSEGGLVSYSGSLTDAYRQAGIYAGKILNGTNPADLPVQQPTKFELAINLKTAKALGLKVPQSLLARADEIIE